MGNSCCFKKPSPIQNQQPTETEKLETKPPEKMPNTTLDVQVKSKLDRERELMLMKKQVETSESERVSEFMKAVMIPPRQTNELLLSSTIKQTKFGVKDGTSKESGQTKFKAGELGHFRSGSILYESAKYKIVECLDSDTGKLFSLKTIQVSII